MGKRTTFLTQSLKFKLILLFRSENILRKKESNAIFVPAGSNVKFILIVEKRHNIQEHKKATKKVVNFCFLRN